MREIKAMLLVLIALATLLIAFPGCEGDQGPEGTTGPQGAPGESLINIRALLMPGEAEGEALSIMSLNNTPSIPQATINSFDFLLRDQWIRGGGRLGYYRYFPLDVGDNADLEVSYTKANGTAGLAQSTVTLPDAANIVSPGGDPVLVYIGDGLDVTWNSVEGADLYYAIVYFGLLYLDTAGVVQVYEFVLDTTLADTSISFTGSQLFPDIGTISDIGGFGADFDVAGISGIWHGPAVNNITGDGMGFFIGVGYGDDLNFVLGIPGAQIVGDDQERNDIGEALTRLVTE